MTNKDYYEILGVAKNSSQQDIKKAYRRLAKKYHPDRNKGDKASEEKFKKITEAYETLSDPQKRKKYDYFGSADPTQNRGAGFGGFGGFGGFDGFTNFGGGSQGAGGFSSIFDELFNNVQGGGRSGRTQSPPPREVKEDSQQHKIEITVEESLQGTSRDIVYDRTQVCPNCRGQNRGFICYQCNNQGIVSKQEKLTVKIPKGIKPDTKMRLGGKGNFDPATQSAGNLYLVINIAPHPFMTRKGKDLYCDLPISFIEALKGGKIEISFLGKNLILKIPPGTQNGTKMRLTGKGPDTGKEKGDLYFTIKIMVPNKIPEDAEPLLNDLEEHFSYNARKDWKI